MWDEEKIKSYWQGQTEKGDNPCHYHNKWQDKYAFEVRLKAFKKNDFAGVGNIVDIGCGVGDYTAALSKLTSAKFTGFDFPFNIDIARKKYARNERVSFVAKSLPDSAVTDAAKGADMVLTTTVYVHLAQESRRALLDALAQMRIGGKVMILEYLPDKIPEFQKGLQYKSVETSAELTDKFEKRGFVLRELRHVNFLDSLIFFHLGKNAISYYLTRIIEAVLHMLRYGKSKYKLLIFEKVA